jgi:putative transposase
VNSVSEKREMIEPNDKHLSVKSQCELIGLAESTYYYKTVCKSKEDDFLQKVDEVSLERPEYGARRIRDELCDAGLKCGRKKVSRAMRLMGIEAKYPKPKTSCSNPEHKKYPYLLNDLQITKPNQVWCADITYIRVKYGWAYMVAILDWATRKVLSWRLSNSMDSSFCIEALNEALELYGTPQYFNTDQGSQFTCADFLQPLKDRHVKISMDGKGRALDNVIVERFWRSLKYEHVYLLEHESLAQTRIGISQYIERYNTLRRHYGISRRTPNEVYYAAA